MDRLQAMSIFITVVEEGSLSAAARRLRLPLTTVSRKISDLELHLNTRLLTRTNRRMTLTDSGEAYAVAAREVLARVEEAERAAAGEYRAPKGELTMTAPIVFGRRHVLPIAVDFLKAFPEISLRLALGDRVTNLIEDHIDLALRIGHLPDSGLTAIRLGTIRRTIYASPAYLETRGMPLHPSDITRHDCVTFEGLLSARSWTFPDGRREVAIPIRSRLSVNTAEAAVDAAAAGLGITRVLSYQAADAVKAGLLLPLLETFEHAPLPVHLVYFPQGLVAQKLRAFLDFATPRLRLLLKDAGSPPDA